MEPGSDTGKLDTATVSAVETLQVLERLEDDGVAGAATVRALDRGPDARIAKSASISNAGAGCRRVSASAIGERTSRDLR